MKSDFAILDENICSFYELKPMSALIPSLLGFSHQGECSYVKYFCFRDLEICFTYLTIVFNLGMSTVVDVIKHFLEEI